MTLIETLSDWARRVDLDAVPDRVIALAESQVLSQLAAVRAGARHLLGAAVTRAFGPPFGDDPARSAYVLAALGAWLHFDDTAFAGHLSNSTVSVPAAYAHALRLDGRALLAAVIAANECAARITAAATLGRFRGQSAAHTHLAGAVVGRLHCACAPAAVWPDALAIAFAMPPWPSMRAYVGSDTSVLSAAMPLRAALDACDAAYAGLRGPRAVLEEPGGFLDTFADVPVADLVASGLGTRWHTDTLSFKTSPAGPGLDAAVDCALDLAPLAVDEIVEVVVTTGLYTISVNEEATRFDRGVDTRPSALLLNVRYVVATALATGAVTPADFAAPAVFDESRWSLAGRVRLEHDPEMTRRSLVSTAPFGAALRQAGPGAAAWLEGVGGRALVDLVGDLGQPEPSFEQATKATPARVEVRLRDGSRVSRERDIPSGAAGDAARAGHRALVARKWRSVGGAPEVAEIAGRLREADAGEVRRMLDGVLA